MRHCASARRVVAPAALACLYTDMQTRLPMVDLAAPTPTEERGPAEGNVPLIDVGGLAERLGVDVRFVRRLVDERRIPFYKVGKHVRFDPADVAHWLADRRVAASGARRLVQDYHSR